MTSRRNRYLALAALAVTTACSGEASFQEAVDSVAAGNAQVSSVSGENALGTLYQALHQSMERAEILEARTADTRLRDLAYSIREERAALLIAVTDEAALTGAQLEPPADSVATRTPVRELREAHQQVLELGRSADSTSFNASFAMEAADASRGAASLLLSFDAAALSPAVLELVRQVAAALTWEAEELSGEGRAVARQQAADSA